MESMERDIIMGLCRLDEDGFGTYSFREYRKEVLKGERDQARVKAINKKLDEYRRVINPVKTNCRNRYIGHLSQRHDGSFTTPEELSKLVKRAVEVMDQLSGDPQQYVLTCTDPALSIDLRARLGM